eukprot:scaffold245_cov256-Pinguiococcus_pyrenoidosus.AAC.29
MLYHGRKLDVQMRREPIPRPQRLEELPPSWTAQRAAVHLFPQELFPLQQPVVVSEHADARRPVMRHEHVQRRAFGWAAEALQAKRI